LSHVWQKVRQANHAEGGDARQPRLLQLGTFGDHPAIAAGIDIMQRIEVAARQDLHQIRAVVEVDHAAILYCVTRVDVLRCGAPRLLRGIVEVIRL
jgi:hypothetical protein